MGSRKGYMGPGDRVRAADKMDHKVLSCFMAILRAVTLRNTDPLFTGGKNEAQRSGNFAPDYHAGMALGVTRASSPVMPMTGKQK